MLTQGFVSTLGNFTDDPIRELAELTPSAEELPEVARASREHRVSDEPRESRLFLWMDR